MHHAAITTMGLKTSPHPLSIAANWSHLMAQKGDAKFIVILAIVLLIAWLITSVGKTLKRAR